MRHAILPVSLAILLAPQLARAESPEAAATASAPVGPLEVAPVGAPRSAPPKSGYEPRNPGMLTAGVVVGSLGALTAGSGGLVFATRSQHGWDGLGQGAGGLLMVAGGGMLFAIGTGLGIAGGIPAGREERRPAMPEVAVGPRAASLKWTF